MTPLYERREAALPIQSHDGDLTKGIRLDVQVHRPRAEPFIESPLIASVQMDSEISRILLCAMLPSLDSALRHSELSG